MTSPRLFDRHVMDTKAALTVNHLMAADADECEKILKSLIEQNNHLEYLVILFDQLNAVISNITAAQVTRKDNIMALGCNGEDDLMNIVLNIEHPITTLGFDLDCIKPTSQEAAQKMLIKFINEGFALKNLQTVSKRLEDCIIAKPVEAAPIKSSLGL